MATTPAERETTPRSREAPAEKHIASPEAVPPVEARRGRPWVRWLVLIALAGSAWHFRTNWMPLIGAMTKPAALPAKPPARPIPVRTAPVGQHDVELHLNGLGTVTASKTVLLRSRVDGEIVKIAFDEGQIVREGDLVAEIDPRPFQEQLKQAEGTLETQRAALRLAKLTLARAEELQRSKSIAQQQIDEFSAQVAQMDGTVRTNEALVETAKLQLTYCKIIAPISGRIGLRLVDQGNIVHANDATGLAVITQLRPITVVFTISQDDISRVQKQERSGEPLAVEAFDRDFRNRLAVGKLAAIDNQVDATTGTLRLKAIFDNDDRALFPNQFVNVRMGVDTLRNAVVVPSAAVQRGPGTAFVYVVQNDEKVKFREVVVGSTEGGETVITSGLQPGDIVVLDGIDKLTDGSSVTTKEKPSGPPGSDKTGSDKKGGESKDGEARGGQSKGSGSKPADSKAGDAQAADSKGASPGDKGGEKTGRDRK